jgi:hypothetical protein
MSEDFLAVFGLFVTIITFATTYYGFFKSHLTSHEVVKNPFTYYALVINLMITCALPLSLIFEFGLSETGFPHKSFSFYCEHYPQIVIYPPLLFGFAGLFILRAAMIRWIFSKKAIIIRIAIAAAAALFAMYYEATGGYMMLLEFNKEAQSASKQFESVSVRARANDLGIGQAFNRPMAIQVSQALATGDGKSVIANTLRISGPWNEFAESWRSKSRGMYLAMFWYMIFIMVFGFSLIPARIKTKKRFRRFDSLLALNLSGAFIIFLMWIPFRIYYNYNTKIPLFGPALSDNFLGILLNYNFAGLAASDIAPTLAVVVFAFFLLLRATDISRKTSIVVIAFVGIGVAIGSSILATARPDIFAAIYGLDGNLRFYIFRIVVLFLILLLTYDFLSSRIDDPSGESPPAKNRLSGR